LNEECEAGYFNYNPTINLKKLYSTLAAENGKKQYTNNNINGNDGGL